MMTDHDHAANLAAFGECVTCSVRSATGSDDLTVEYDCRPVALFDGPTLAPEDHERLRGQLRRVFDALSDHLWHTLAELAGATASPEASVSARIRDLRKPRWGAWVIEHERTDVPGVWRYRLMGKRTTQPG